ncbi:MAG: hypothetical protein RIC85_01575 [Gammaproteobacteria bacterium]
MKCELCAIESARVRLGPAYQTHEFKKRFPQETLNPRQAKIVDKMLNDFKGKLTTKKWAAINKCSPTTAEGDIADLIKRGALSQDEDGTRSASYTLVLKV